MLLVLLWYAEGSSEWVFFIIAFHMWSVPVVFSSWFCSEVISYSLHVLHMSAFESALVVCHGDAYMHALYYSYAEI